ncbi:MAG: hypothetical protein HY911_04315 [Desulfobacterales bacterium]|nr:hypothetical protein [Desulfobacterales bacterium]
MSKGSKSLDPNQMIFEFDFDAEVDRYIEARQQIAEAIEAGPSRPSAKSGENEFEVCIEIAAAAKRCIREWGGSREQLVDEINIFFGRSAEGTQTDPPTCRNPLTIHMLNNYLSKPIDYPLPAYLLVAIQHVTGLMYPSRAIVSYEGAQVATGTELRQMTLGKLEETLFEMRRLKRELGRR